VPQGFDWGWFRPDDAPKQRFPTLDEYRSMCWQHVAAGANGLVGYCFYKFWEPKDAKAEKRSAYFREEHWQTICAVGEEVKRLSPVMLSVDPAPAVTGVTDAVRVRTWSCEGNLYVLAVNRLNETAEATLQIAGGGWKTAKAELGAEQALADGGQLKIRLGPLGVSFVRLSTKL